MAAEKDKVYTAYTLANSYGGSSNAYSYCMDYKFSDITQGKIKLTVATYMYCRWTGDPYHNFSTSKEGINIKVDGSVVWGSAEGDIIPKNAASWLKDNSRSFNNTTYGQYVKVASWSGWVNYNYNEENTYTISSTYSLYDGGESFVPSNPITVSTSLTAPTIGAPYRVYSNSQTEGAAATEIRTSITYILPSGVSLEKATIYYRERGASSYSFMDVTSSPNDFTITGLKPDTWYETTSCIKGNGVEVYYSGDLDAGDVYTFEEAGWSAKSTRTPTPTLKYTYKIEEDDIGSGPWKVTVDLSGTTVSPTKTLSYSIAGTHGIEQEISDTKSVFYNIPEETSILIQIGVTALSDSGVPELGYAGENIEFITPADQAKAYTRQGNSWSFGKVYFKTGDTWVKAKKIYVKEGGVWKEGD